MNEIEKLAEAKRLLMVAVAHAKHGDDCAGWNFWESHKYLPCNHPGWLAKPPCNCWVKEVQNFMNETK
jgi:hypothetical protein